MKKYVLKYEMPLEFSKTLAFMEPRAMKGMEIVNGKSYSRTFRIERTEGYFIVKNNPVKSALELTVNSKNDKYHTTLRLVSNENQVASSAKKRFRFFVLKTTSLLNTNGLQVALSRQLEKSRLELKNR